MGRLPQPCTSSPLDHNSGRERCALLIALLQALIRAANRVRKWAQRVGLSLDPPIAL